MMYPKSLKLFTDMTDKPQPPKSRKELEQLLRKFGFSQRQARRITLEGFFPKSVEREAIRAVRKLVESDLS